MVKFRNVVAAATLTAASLGAVTADAFVLGPTVPGKWGPPAFGTGATITWSLMPTGTSCASEFAGCSVTAAGDFLPAGYLTEITNAFSAWSSVANLTFTQVADDIAGMVFICGPAVTVPPPRVAEPGSLALLALSSVALVSRRRAQRSAM